MKYRFLIPFIIIVIFITGCEQDQFTLTSQKSNAVIVIGENEQSYVNLAVQDLIADIQKISGQQLEISHQPVKGKSNLIIGTVGQSPFISAEFDSIQHKWECYSVKTTGKDLIIAGSNPRGTMFGIYWFIENHLGVDPFYWWKDLEPEHKDELVFGTISHTSAEPDFKFRGWFINDEDLMTEFMDGGGKRELDYPYYQQVIHPDLAERVFEAAVRLRYNLIIPASFIEIFNPAEEKLLELASARGLYLSQHHVEPMGVSAFGYFNYWNRKTGEKPLFSYYSEKEKVTEVWKESVKRWSKYPDVIWQIGLRGIADRPMWLADPGVPQSDIERAGIISDAMQTQMEILNEIMPGENHEVTTTLWGEGAVFNEIGLLKFPENTTIIFADNSPGWVMPEDFHKTKREPGINYGIYYHHGLIGSGPHLAQAVPPSKTHEIFSLAKELHSDYYAILNAGNVREFVLGIEASRDIMENTAGFNPDEWLGKWCQKNFGESGQLAFDAYTTYFSSFVIDDVHATPLLLDGLAKGRSINNLNAIKIGLNNEDPKVETPLNSLQKDAFRKSLEKAYPGGQMTPEQWLAKASIQDSVLSESMKEAELVLQKLSGQQKQLFENNLVAQIKFMQCLTGCAVETTAAVISMHEKDSGSAKTYLQKGLDKFNLYEEAVHLGSRGKWENWYRGETKINVKRLRNDIQITLNQLNEQRN